MFRERVMLVPYPMYFLDIKGLMMRVQGRNLKRRGVLGFLENLV